MLGIDEQSIKIPLSVINYFDFEPIYRDYFRLEILGTSLEEILKTRNTWSFSRYFNTGNGYI
jgi:hypothetical protein